MEIFARSSKLLRSCVLEIPEFVFHSAIKFFWILFPFQMKFYTYSSILQTMK